MKRYIYQPTNDSIWCCWLPISIILGSIHGFSFFHPSLVVGIKIMYQSIHNDRLYVPDMHCILWTTSGYIIEDWAVFTKDACGYNYMQSCELTVACLTCIVSQMETRPGSVAGHRVQAATADELHWLMQVSSASSMLWMWSEEPQIGRSHLPIAVQLFHWWNLVQ